MEHTVSEHYVLSNTCAVELIDITVRLGNKDVLKSVDLTIEQGGM